MIEIPDPPTVAACASCMQPLVHLYSARTSRWVTFVAADVGRTIRPHPCRSEATGWPTWRESRHGSPPSAEYRAAKAALSRPSTEEQPS